MAGGFPFARLNKTHAVPAFRHGRSRVYLRTIVRTFVVPRGTGWESRLVVRLELAHDLAPCASGHRSPDPQIDILRDRADGAVRQKAVDCACVVAA